jgi:3-dehydroquinate dehydratase
MGNNRKQLAQIEKKLSQLQSEVSFIKAQHEKEIYGSTSYDHISYNTRLRLQEADLTIALRHDNEYQRLIEEMRELRAEQTELEEDNPFSMGGLIH